MDQTSSHTPYVLITPARNEEAFIEKTIEAVTRQTVLPIRWVIVDDGSTDGTAEVVRRRVARYPWIEMLQMPPHHQRSFAGKVYASMPATSESSPWRTRSSATWTPISRST